MDVELFLLAVVGLGGMLLGWTSGCVERRRLRRSAVTDPLTGLANRRGWERHADRVLRRLGPGRAAVVLVDVDRLKALNGEYGHAGGDQAIAAVGDRLRSCPSVVTAGRLGGDEFAAVLDIGAAPHVTVAGLHERLCGPVGAMGVTVSVGAAVADKAGLRDLLARADAAMFAAKERRPAYVLSVTLTQSEFVRARSTGGGSLRSGFTSAAIGASR